jgi:hypothetical protein
MPDSTYALTALRNELVELELVRKPSIPGAQPAMHVEPRGGAPAPGDREGAETTGELVVTLRLGGDVVRDTFNTGRALTSVDVVYRSSTTAGLKAGRALDAAVRALLTGNATYGIGLTLDAGGPNPLHVIQASMFAGLGPVADVDGVRTERASYLLEYLA